MAVRLKPYSDYLDSIGALTGISDSIGISTDIAEVFRLCMNSAISRVWQETNWLDACPMGEARFVGNKLTYPNDLSQTSTWTASNLTITGDNFVNPMDGRTTASKCMETAATDVHDVAQGSIPIIRSTDYTLSVYARYNGRDWVSLKFNDGVNNYSGFYDVATGTLGTAGGTGATISMAEQANGYYLCTLNFTTAATATTTGTATIRLATGDGGAFLSYLGVTTKGLYIWGALLQQTTNTGLNDSLVEYDQTGESRMEAVFQVWKDSPFATSTPRPITYELTRTGIQIISSGSALSYAAVNAAGVVITSKQSNPVFVYYRKQVGDFSGATYDATATYAVGDQIYFTNGDSDSDFYVCVKATSAGDDPDTDPDKWDVIEIPESLFYPIVWFAYSEWLTQDGQLDKALAAESMATKRVADQGERESRQMRKHFPFQVSTHASTMATA